MNADETNVAVKVSDHCGTLQIGEEREFHIHDGPDSLILYLGLRYKSIPLDVENDVEEEPEDNGDTQSKKRARPLQGRGIKNDSHVQAVLSAIWRYRRQRGQAPDRTPSDEEYLEMYRRSDSRLLTAAASYGRRLGDHKVGASGAIGAVFYMAASEFPELAKDFADFILNYPYFDEEAQRKMLVAHGDARVALAKAFELKGREWRENATKPGEVKREKGYLNLMTEWCILAWNAFYLNKFIETGDIIRVVRANRLSDLILEPH